MRDNVKTAHRSGAAESGHGDCSVHFRRLLGLILATALILPGAALAETGTTTGYNQTPPPPKTETTTTTTTVTTTTPGTTTTAPTSGVAPTKTETTKTEPAAKHEVAPTKTSATSTTPTTAVKPTTTPTTATTAAKALPFTGFDLRWVIVAGVFLLGAGLSIVFVQRRRQGMGR